MTTQQFTVVLEPDRDGFHAYVPTLPGCHSFGLTLDEVQANIREAIELHVAVMRAAGESIPLESEALVIMRLSVPVAA